MGLPAATSAACRVRSSAGRVASPTASRYPDTHAGDGADNVTGSVNSRRCACGMVHGVTGMLSVTERYPEVEQGGALIRPKLRVW